MDTYMSANEVARQLGTNADRVLRTARLLGLPNRRAGSAKNAAVLFAPAQVERIRAELGPTINLDMSRAASKVLAAVVSAPRGLSSARAVARRADVAPTTAAHVLAELESRGFISTSMETVAAGRATELSIIRATAKAAATNISAVPATRSLGRPATRVPFALKHVFWNTHPDQLDARKWGGYIARRLIQAENPDGIAWGVRNLTSDDWLHASDTRGLHPRMRQMARNIAAAQQ